MAKIHIELSTEDRAFLDNLLAKGSQKVRVQKRALALKKLDAGMSYSAVATFLEVSYPTISSWAKKYRSEGLVFLQDKARSGRPPILDGEQRAKITALACSTPPEGYSQWSLRLLSDRLVCMEIVPTISHTQVGKILKKTNFNHI